MSNNSKDSQLEWQRKVLRDEQEELGSLYELRKDIADRINKTLPQRSRRSTARMEKKMGKRFS